MTHPAGRHVHRLHLRVAHRDDAGAGAVLVEDALRTASLGGADDVLVLVRRLDLGAIPLGASPGAVALRIERAFRAVRATAVRCDAPGAARADAVLVPDVAAALVHLAGRHARGGGTEAWFWPRLVPGWRAAQPAAEGWRRLLEAADARPGAPLVHAALVHAADENGGAAALHAALTPGAARARLALCGWPSDPGALPAPADAPAAGAAPMPSRPAPTPVDARDAWIETMRAVYARPAGAADPRLPLRVEAALLRTHTSPAPGDGDGGAHAWNAGPRPEGGGEEEAVIQQAPRVPRAVPGAPSPSTAGGPRGVASSPDGSAPLDPGTIREATMGAGLLFVVPLLERHGLAAWLAAHPERLDDAQPARLLRAIGARSGMPEADPLLACLAMLAGDASAPGGLDLPPPLQALLDDPTPARALGAPVDRWRLALHRWCRRRMRLALSAVVLRPGRLQVSRTHLDLYFDLGQADLRLRRHALDVDPGWVPWLGRVVTFHYD